MTRRVLWTGGVALAVSVIAVAAVVRASLPQTAAEQVPTSQVVRSTLRLDVHANGELRAARSVSLSAPPAGGALRLVYLAPTGTSVREGDVVLEFDPADQQYTLEQSRSELAEAEQAIIKIRTDTEAQAAQDQVDLLTARFDVRRAELDAASPAELLGAIEARKRELALEEARRKLAELQQNVKSRAETGRASIAVAEEKRTKARLATERAQQIIDSLIVKAPFAGLVAAKENRNAAGGFFFTGMTLPEYRSGDAVQPGQVVADLLDASALEIRAKVNEQERANLVPGQAASVTSDALPGRALGAKVAALAGQAQRSAFFDQAGPSRQFDAVLKVDRPAAQLLPGTSVRVVITGTEIAGVLHVPRQAMFEKNGKPIVYVKTPAGFEAREVQVKHRTESRVEIAGIAEGTAVALVNPETSRRPAAPAASVPAAAAGGPR